MNDCDVAIIGAGHNGLVAAFYLARAGLHVRLFEMRRKPGGAAVTEELWPGMFFSTCAHLLHGMPALLHRDMRLAERGLQVLVKAPWASVESDDTFWGPPSMISSRNRILQMTAEERRGEDAFSAFRAALARIGARYRRRLPPSLAQAFAEASSEEADVLARALRMRSSQLHAAFLPTERLREAHGADRASIGRDPGALSYVTDAMGAPDEETGEAYPHGFVRGGMGELARAVAEAAGEAGAEITLGTTVTGCLVENARVSGIRLRDGTEVRARAVLSNRDPKSTILDMLPPDAVPPHLARGVATLPTNVSCYKFLAVLSEVPDWKAWDGDPMERARGGTMIGHGRAGVAAAYDDAEAGRPPRAPVVSVSVPSTIDQTLARPGYHTASVWIYPAPAHLAGGRPWREVREEVGERIIDQVTGYAPNFRRSILEWRLRTPEDIARMHGMTDGCIWHVQHEAEALLGNRPLPELAHYRAHLAGLYLCGAGQHPWGEVTGLPGYNAAREVLRDLA